jgi:hypothetical protein
MRLVAWLKRHPEFPIAMAIVAVLMFCVALYVHSEIAALARSIAAVLLQVWKNIWSSFDWH